jgi:hypothetical protein
MNKFALSISLSALLVSAAFAQSNAPAASAPAVKAATAFHAVCKDGTPFDGASKQGACSGHGGIDKKATKAAEDSTPKAASAVAAKPAATAATTTSKPAAPTASAAVGGGDGKVWVNDNTKVFHCQGDKFYGKTKKGEYMTLADANAKGYHADKGSKACAAK